jgi:hypothetical protein
MNARIDAPGLDAAAISVKRALDPAAISAKSSCRRSQIEVLAPSTRPRYRRKQAAAERERASRIEVRARSTQRRYRRSEAEPIERGDEAVAHAINLPRCVVSERV